MRLVTAKHGGLLYLSCVCGERALKDQKLGEIRNLKGEVLQELIAPIDGLIHCVFPKHIKRPGERIVGMRRILE
jgi:predicted deacylase